MSIVRNFVLLLFLSFVVVFWTSFSGQIIGVIQHAFNTASGWLSISVGGHVLGATLRNIVALVVIPVVAGLLTYVFFWILKKQPTTALSWVMWSVWLVLATIFLAHK